MTWPSMSCLKSFFCPWAITCNPLFELDVFLVSFKWLSLWFVSVLDSKQTMKFVFGFFLDETMKISLSHEIFFICLRLNTRALDVLWSCYVICPLIIVFWSGTWRILDLSFFSLDAFSAAVWCWLLGFLITLAGYFVLPFLEATAGTSDDYRHIVISKSFLYVYAFGMIAHWRGIWGIAEIWTGTCCTISNKL